jgi:hypothetical protein
MRQKLKKLLLLTTGATLVAGVCLGFGLGAKTASADSLNIVFVCQDGTTDISIKKNTAQHSVIVTCSSGSKIVYVNYESLGIQPVAVAATCPGSESVSPNVDAANAPTSQYVITCVNVVGHDNTTSTPTNDIPDVKNTDAGGVSCPDGSSAKNNDVQNCPVTSVTDPALKGGNCSDVNKCDLINKYLNPFINFLAALVGVAVVASIIIGAIQYGGSAGDPAQVTAAKNRIRNAILALVTFLFLYALLNFLIPGGLF